jgi:hypothetical protein
MNSEKIYKCNFCNTVFASKGNLTTHQKNVKYCLNIQKQYNSSLKEEFFKCEFCNKQFNSKKSHIRHKDICKEKVIKENNNEKELEIINLKLQHEKELEKQKNEKYEEIKNLKLQHEKELEKQKNEKYKEIKNLKLQHEKELEKQKNEYEIKLIKSENELKLKNEQLKKLEDKYDSFINEIKNEKIETNKYLLEQACSKNSVVNKSYNLQFNTLIDEISPFNENNIKLRIKKMDSNKIANSNDSINNSFISNFVDVIKDLTFCTDASRGFLIIKDEDGVTERITSQKFVLECFKKANKELLEICYEAEKYVRNNEHIFDELEAVEIREKLATMICLIRENKLNSIIKQTATKVIHDCKHLNKPKGNKVFKNIIEKTDEYDPLKEKAEQEREEMLKANPDMFNETYFNTESILCYSEEDDDRSAPRSDQGSEIVIEEKL